MCLLVVVFVCQQHDLCALHELPGVALLMKKKTIASDSVTAWVGIELMY